MATGITQAELLEALAAAACGSAPEEAKTMKQLRRETGFSEKRVREALEAMQDAGRLQVHFITKPRVDGKPQPVPAYTVRRV